MKRFISIFLCFTMMMSMLTFTVSADAATTVYGDTAVFVADYDTVSPTPKQIDSANVTIGASVDGNAITITPDASLKKSVSYTTSSFTLDSETILKLDIMAVGNLI